MTLRDDLALVLRQSRRLIVLLLLIVVPVIYLLSGLFSVGAEERGTVMRFGKIVRDDVMPGMHYHLPWPIETVATQAATSLRSMEIDFSAQADERLQPELTTGDEDLVDVSLLVQYTISEPGRFINAARATESVLREVAVSETLFYVGATAIDPLLTTGRTRLQDQLKTSIQASVSDLDLGIRITSVQIRRLEPPSPIKKSFDNVAQARAEKHKQVQESMGERNSRLAEARSEANRLRQEAQATATEVVETARGDADYFLAILHEYKKAPALTANRFYLEKLEAILSKVQVTVVNPGNRALTYQQASSAPHQP